MIAFIFILALAFSAFLIGLFIVFYYEGRELRKIEHFHWLRKAGFEESAYLMYSNSTCWTNFCG